MRRAARAAGPSLDRLRRARDALARRFGGHPGVTGIDIGIDPAHGGPDPDSPIVLRVHVARDAVGLLDLPAAVEGIPVRVVTGDYRPG
jgi:hypothetical protein